MDQALAVRILKGLYLGAGQWTCLAAGVAWVGYTIWQRNKQRKAVMLPGDQHPCELCGTMIPECLAECPDCARIMKMSAAARFWWGVAVPLGLQLCFTGALFIGDKSKGPFGGGYGAFVYAIFFIPVATVANIVVTCAWPVDRIWVLVLRGILVAINSALLLRLVH